MLNFSGQVIGGYVFSFVVDKVLGFGVGVNWGYDVD